jgi:outer membrane receptor protein involved in Fe transport
MRRLGYAPKIVRVKLTGASDSTRITLIDLPEQLQGVTATQQRARMEIEQFYRRRARGPGTFFTRDEIEDRHAISLSDVLRMAPGVQVVRQAGANGIRFTSGSARRNCMPLIWLDGQKAPGMEVDQIPLSDIEGIELYQGASTTPTQFFQNIATTCGTIIVWTRLPGV